MLPHFRRNLAVRRAVHCHDMVSTDLHGVGQKSVNGPGAAGCRCTYNDGIKVSVSRHGYYSACSEVELEKTNQRGLLLPAECRAQLYPSFGFMCLSKRCMPMVHILLHTQRRGAVCLI